MIIRKNTAKTNPSCAYDMKILDLTKGEYLSSVPFDTVIAVGNFDGVHKGHAALLSEAKRLADSLGCMCAVWSFENYTPKCRGVCITLPSERAAIFKAAGIGLLITCDYEQVSEMSCSDFVNDIIIKRCRAVHAVCGYNFRFGKGASGDAEKLSSLIKTTVVGAVSQNGQTVSSTAIREFISSGDMTSANLMLGRPFSVTLPVVHGRHIGTSLSIPTINQNFPPEHIVPRHGVYACIAHVGEASYPAASNVGVRPTVGGDSVNCETNIIGFCKDLYGCVVSIDFIRFIRPEMKFSSLDALKAQINKDIEKIKIILGKDG